MSLLILLYVLSSEDLMPTTVLCDEIFQGKRHTNYVLSFHIARSFNPIENVCDIIDNRLKTMRSKNLKELQSMIQQIWDNITEETCKKLVDSMLRRLKRCQRVKGATMCKY